MRKLLRHDIFQFGLLAGIFATLVVVLVAGVILLWGAPWVVPFGQQPPSPQQISMLRWDQQGFPLKVNVIYSTLTLTPTSTEITASNLSDITFDGYKLWVTGSINDTRSDGNGKGYVFYIEPRTYETVKQINVGSKPRGILFDGQHIWVANHGDSTVSCIEWDPTKSNSDNPPRELDGSSPYYLAFDGKNIWVTSPDDNSLWRLPAGSCETPDYSQNDTKFHIKYKEKLLSQPYGIIFDGTFIWVAYRGSNEVIRLNPDTNEARTIEIGDEGSQPFNLTYDGKYVWVTLQGTDQVARINAATARVIEPFIDVGRQPWGIAYDGTYIWVANNWDESVSRIRAADGVVVETFETDGAASRFAFDGTFMWVTNYGGDPESSFLTRR